jgi:hypothetical protein
VHAHPVSLLQVQSLRFPSEQGWQVHLRTSPLAILTLGQPHDWGSCVSAGKPRTGNSTHRHGFVQDAGLTELQMGVTVVMSCTQDCVGEPVTDPAERKKNRRQELGTSRSFAIDQQTSLSLHHCGKFDGLKSEEID